MFQLAFYKKSPGVVSRLIRRFTRSAYSHVAVATLGGVFEAVGRGFVLSATLGMEHERGTLVDLLEYKTPLTAAELARATDCCRGLVGAKYDYEMVLAGFPLRYEWEPKSARTKFFCSEAAFLACAAMGPGRMLLDRCQPWEVSPEDLFRSPQLVWVNTITI